MHAYLSHLISFFRVFLIIAVLDFVVLIGNLILTTYRYPIPWLRQYIYDDLVTFVCAPVIFYNPHFSPLSTVLSNGTVVLLIILNLLLRALSFYALRYFIKVWQKEMVYTNKIKLLR